MMQYAEFVCVLLLFRALSEARSRFFWPAPQTEHMGVSVGPKMSEVLALYDVRVPLN